MCGYFINKMETAMSPKCWQPNPPPRVISYARQLILLFCHKSEEDTAAHASYPLPQSSQWHVAKVVQC